MAQNRQRHRKPKGRPLDGWLIIDKPTAIGSTDVVTICKRAFQAQKCGHGGTLDPLATGVLLVCVGPAVRLSEFLMGSPKTYVAAIHLGRETTTDDGEGEITAERPADHLSATQIEAALTPFLGDIEQIPPIYSAIKQRGKKMYQLARAGKAVEAAPRPVRIDSLRLLEWSAPIARVEVVCGPGTYIRSLARDVGQALGVGGSLAGLQRTRSGIFGVDTALSGAMLSNRDALRAAIVPMHQALPAWPVARVDEAGITDLRNGKRIGGPDAEAGTLALALAADDTLIALLRAVPGGWQPERVLK